jgi:drug/metabolite transporter (DMT)-like permease
MTSYRAYAPAAALVLNAFIWGTSWWPFRQLQGLGLHPLWTTVFVYALAVAVILIARPRSALELARSPRLWVLVLASGFTNASFNWAVSIGDVVRVVLLFYLMPLWSVLLARAVLKEAITPAALLRVALALAGAALVLGGPQIGQPGAGFTLPWPRSLPDWLGLLGGFSFALNNVMLRREAASSDSARALAMFVGGVAVAGLLGVGLQSQGQISAWPAWDWRWVAGALVLALWFLMSNLALQYGAARLSANGTAIIMLSEVVFASVSAWLLGAGELGTPVLLGGTLIVGAALLAARPASKPE